jgi:hypothetical protein
MVLRKVVRSILKLVVPRIGLAVDELILMRSGRILMRLGGSGIEGKMVFRRRVCESVGVRDE